MNFLKEYKLELKLIVLSLLTYYLWLNTNLFWAYSVAIYGLIFIYLIITKKPISHFIIVTIFSIVAKNQKLTPDYDYFMTAILFMIVIIKMFIDKQIVMGKLLLILIINFLYSIISLSYTPDFKYGLYGLGGLFQGYMGYMIITNSRLTFNKNTLIHISKAASFFLLVITAQIIYKYAHFDLTKIHQLKSAVELGWQYSNLVAPFYIFFIPLSLYKHTKKERFYFIYALVDLLNILGLVLTLSRGGYLGLAAALFIFFIFNIKNWRMVLRLGSIAVLTTLTVYIIPWSNKLINTLFQSLGKADFFDDNNRYNLWEPALELFKQKPIFGWGVNASNHLIPTYLNGRTNHFFHNFIIQVAVCLGIIGVAILFILLIKSFFILFKPSNKFIISIGAAIGGSLVHQSVDVMFDYLMFGLVFYILIGLAELYRHQDQKDPFNLIVIQKG